MQRMKESRKLSSSPSAKVGDIVDEMLFVGALEGAALGNVMCDLLLVGA